MQRSENASLKKLNSFAVEARTRLLITLEDQADLQTLASDHPFDPENDLILGAGSNVLFANDISGKVILNRIIGKKIINEADSGVLIEVSAGENWHQLVLWSLEQGLSGIENLSLIPGLAGAAPMQNIGAYGVELADVLESVQALELGTGVVHDFTHDECKFSYRDSRFKSADAEKFLITSIRLRLQRSFTARLAYAGIVEELHSMEVNHPTARQVSNAVVRIRQRKLPDPDRIGNAGSFFKNPVLSHATAKLLANDFAGLPVYVLADGNAKLSAAWMIDHCGWKGHRRGDAGVSQQHALVLVNHGNASGQDLLALAAAVGDSVQQRFGIGLTPEPRIIQ